MASAPTRQHLDVEKRHLSRCSSLKIGYDSKAEALDAAESMMEKGRVNRGCHITPYCCKECKQWHVWNRPIYFTKPTETT